MLKRNMFFPRSRGTSLAVAAACVAGIGLAAGGLAWSVTTYLTSPTMPTSDTQSLLSQGPDEDGAQALVLSDEEWMQSVRSGRAFRNRSQRSASPSLAPPRGLGMFAPFDTRRAPFEDTPGGATGTFKTVCVRLCDGYAFPISFSTTSSNFERDQQACQRSCSSPARLYVHRQTGTDPPEMYDLRGRPYSALPTANFYQATYDENCKCKPHPWEAEALERHRIYALEAKSRKGDKAARAELKQIRAGAVNRSRDDTGSRRTNRRRAERSD